MTTTKALIGNPQTGASRNSRGAGEISRLSGFAAVLCASTILQVPLFALADSNVIGFWDFKGGTAGDSAGTVSASVGNWTGTAYKAHASNGALPTYSASCPDAVIFTDETRSEVLVENPQSLHFSLLSGGYGGYVDIAGLSTELTTHTEFTIEFFSRFDDASGLPWTEPLAFRTTDRYVSVSVGQGDTKRMKFNYLGIDLSGAAGTKDFPQDILDKWVQVAFVYKQTDAESHSGDLKCYVNRSLKTTIAYTNTPLGEVSQPLRLGTSLGNNRIANAPYNFRGDICALRIKSVALDESGFMLKNYTVPQGAMLGFWDFKDGAVGASANSVTNKVSLSILDPGVGSALSDLTSVDKGVTPVFSDDVPGPYIYSSSIKAGKRLVDNPQSLLFTTEKAGESTQSADYQSVGGGMIKFANLGSAITVQSSYTIECFFKDEDWSNWQWASGLFGFYANDSGGTKANIQAMVSSVKSGTTSWNLQLSAPVNATYIKDKKPWNDGEWHHLAVVYDGSASPSTMSIYVDHALGQTVSYENYCRDNEPFVLGTRADQSGKYAFRGKICCLRIMPKALGIGDFMVATDRLPGLTLVVR